MPLSTIPGNFHISLIIFLVLIVGGILVSRRFFPIKQNARIYKNYKFTTLLVHPGNGLPNRCLLTLFLNDKINFDAYICTKHPGIVLFKKRVRSLPGTEDKLYVFSDQPEKAKYFLRDEKNLNLIREIMEQSFTEGAKPHPKLMPEYLQNYHTFSINKNKITTNIVVADGTKQVDIQLIQPILDKMIMLAENLRTVPN